VAITASGLATVAASVASYLNAHCGGTIAILVTKSLATPIVSKALLLVMKKVVASAIIAATAKAIALEPGISLHAAVMVVLIPLILGLVAWDIAHFPSELGENVARQVRNELDGTFAEVNTAIAESRVDNIIDSFVDAGVSSIVEGWIRVPDVADALSQLTGAPPAT
jgi:hypothetical protein